MERKIAFKLKVNSGEECGFKTLEAEVYGVQLHTEPRPENQEKKLTEHLVGIIN